MKHFWPYIAMLLFVMDARGQGAGQIVVPPERRAQVIAQGERYTRFDETATLTRINNLTTPFLFPEELRGDGLTLPTHKPIYSDEDVVKTVARSLKPQGLLVKGSQQCLYLAQGKLAVGDTFHAVVQGVPYSLTLDGVTNTSFTLRLGNATWTQPFDAVNSSAIHFDKK